jgi:hypothetical protein
MIWTDSLYNTTEVASNKLSSFLNILIQNGAMVPPCVTPPRLFSPRMNTSLHHMNI